MKQPFLMIMLIATLFFFNGILYAQKDKGSGFYDIEVESIDGKKYKLSEYENKVVLVVNTASECGLRLSINLFSFFTSGIIKKD